MEYSTAYEYYLKHVELWYTISELLKNKDDRILSNYECFGYPGSMHRIKRLALKDLGYENDFITNSCFACESLGGIRCGLENQCILKWDSVHYKQIAYACEKFKKSPYKKIWDITENGEHTPSTYPWYLLSTLAKKVSLIPFNDNKYSKYKREEM